MKSTFLINRNVCVLCYRSEIGYLEYMVLVLVYPCTTQLLFVSNFHHIQIKPPSFTGIASCL